MVQFWLDDFSSLFSLSNLNIIGNDTKTNKLNKILNLISIIIIILGLSLTILRKSPFYFGISIILLSFIILINSTVKLNNFVSTPVDLSLSNAFDTGTVLVKPVNGGNRLYLSFNLNLNKGDVIALQDIDKPTELENHVIADIKNTTDTGTPVLILLNDISGVYNPNKTKILKVSGISPNIVPPPDGNVSINNVGKDSSDPESMAIRNYPPFTLPNAGRYDWNLELSTMIPGEENTYKYQGQPFGPLKSRTSTVENPMGTVNITEYDNAPTFFGTVNVGDFTDGVSNNTIMTENQEATVSMRVDDLLFHKGNSQAQFSPMAADTIPNNQEAFAHFCYRSPTNLVNVKYGSIFVNDPEKFKLVTRLAKATGTEGGGAGGGGGRP